MLRFDLERFFWLGVSQNGYRVLCLMRKVQQFRQRARECRVAAARSANNDLQRHYLNLAEVWEKLADERLAFFVQHPDVESDRKEQRRRATG